MIEFLSLSNNLPFTVALAMMLILAVIEVLGFLIGASASDFLHGWFDFAVVDADGGELAGSSIDKLMGWLHFGKVPVLILIAVFLVSFGAFGLLLQGAMSTLTGALLPWWLASAVALPLALPGVRVFGGTLAKILPRDETQVVSQSALIGRVATIVLGTARQGSPAQAKVRDQHGQTHYVMLEPDEPGASFAAGDTVLLVSHAGATDRAIRDNNPALHS